jgi:hypothetical protein
MKVMTRVSSAVVSVSTNAPLPTTELPHHVSHNCHHAIN